MDLSGVNWRKSSYSTSNSNCVEVGMSWRKSSHSSSDGACVELARHLPAVVAVRDSKDPQGPVLTFPAEAWQAFTARLKAGGPGLG